MTGTNDSVKRQVDLQEAARLLRAGELVAVPTETVYGLAARADDARAIANIYRTKGRPDFNPLIVHVGSLEQAEKLAMFDERAREIAAKFWPGPLTMVLPLRENAPIAPAITAGLPTIALRMPAHQTARELLETLDFPLAAPSANRSTGVSPTCPEHVAASLGEACPAILDGGPCEAGLESTIIALREGDAWQMLRPGPVSLEQLEILLGIPQAISDDKIEAPGQMKLHYSPGKPVRLNATSAKQGEFLIGYGEISGHCSLSETGDLAEAAAQLYACLHLAGASEHERIAIAPIPQDGMGAAINDRLTRAASL